MTMTLEMYIKQFLHHQHENCRWVILFQMVKMLMSQNFLKF